MQWKKVLLAIIIGVILFLTDMRFGWISFAIGGVWTLFIIMFIVGILSGDIAEGFLAGILTELIGVGILALIPDIFFTEITVSATDFLARMWIVMGLSLSYSLRFPDAPVPWIEGLVIIILLIALAPVVYVMALLFSFLGGILARIIHPRIFKPKEAPAYVPSQEPRPSTPQPPQHEPMEEALEPEEEAEEESSAPDLEPSG